MMIHTGNIAAYYYQLTNELNSGFDSTSVKETVAKYFEEAATNAG